MAKLGERVLTRLRRCDPDALRAIVDAHARPLYRAARGMGFTIEEAEDLAQNVFVTFIESLERFEGRAQIGTWLFGILHHKAQERRWSRTRDELNDPWCQRVTCKVRRSHSGLACACTSPCAVTGAHLVGNWLPSAMPPAR